jgi:hypothetical protein
VAAVLGVGLAVLAGYVVSVRDAGDDVRGSPSIEFVTTDVPAPKNVPTTTQTKPARSTTASWPTYGYDNRRLRAAHELDHRPPFRRLWTFRGRALLEFPPAVAYGRVYLPTFDGRFYALDARTGRTRWTYRTTGRIKGSPALSGGRLYVGDYDGSLYALHARTGRLAWRAAAQPRLGGRGGFYSTPALGYGRVFIGNNDGKVYAFGATSGRLLWSQSTGGYVYASPAVWRRSILVGSYDRSFYALDAATGDVRWHFRANGPISGSASVLGGIVYFSTFAERTYALDAASGRELWRWPDGKYSPVVADRERVYLVGLGRLYGAEVSRCRESAPKVLDHRPYPRPQRRATEVHHAGREHLRAAPRLVVRHLRALPRAECVRDPGEHLNPRRGLRRPRIDLDSVLAEAPTVAQPVPANSQGARAAPVTA